MPRVLSAYPRATFFNPRVFLTIKRKTIAPSDSLSLVYMKILFKTSALCSPFLGGGAITGSSKSLCILT